jgi:hypothetical protein
MCRQCGGRGQGPSPRDTLRRYPLRHSIGGTRSIGCGFGDPQKIRSRGEGPPGPARRRRRESRISESGHEVTSMPVCRHEIA